GDPLFALEPRYIRLRAEPPNLELEFVCDFRHERLPFARNDVRSALPGQAIGPAAFARWRFRAHCIQEEWTTAHRIGRSIRRGRSASLKHLASAAPRPNRARPARGAAVDAPRPRGATRGCTCALHVAPPLSARERRRWVRPSERDERTW